ncbi:GNAT family N-acetyltransferase [Advenella mimigardefordensis]|uniref:Putative acetyltransferase, GNAT family n=1 Tax=Advenella mimigardefordensis (strain DSM 17166 / LMG 22922 / DPN7) TaxID=1247726 RepID=W0PFD0_ADVMD|nr:GNAT family N-acetyltransferase [Advenella mimigardefordensis]AHG65401.1 putative acetyltransferase, GNAT family [Advenella mimigardefordensis DPN7]
MTETTIRVATTSDISAIKEIVNDAYGHYVERIGSKPAPMTDDYAQHVEKQTIWVLDSPNGVAGLMVLRTDADFVLVSNVAVSKAHQGKGFGKRLLDFADTFTTQKGKCELRLYTNELMHENLAIYSKLGWEEYARAEQDGFRRVFMRKTLPQPKA